MKTIDSFDMMEKLLPDIVELLSDEDIVQFKEETRSGKKIKAEEAINSLLPLFVVKHKDATLRIVAAVSDKTVDEVKEQPLAVTTADFKFIDEVYGFFASCLRLVLKA